MDYISKPQDFVRELFKLEQDKEYKFTVKENKKKRSLNANGLMWQLCQDRAEKMNITKEEVYRKHIKEVGVFDTWCMRDKAIKRFIAEWCNKGIGWVCDIDTSKLDGCTNVLAYYGSSTYDTKEMSRLIDNLIQDCHNLGIMTPQDKEIEKMIVEWGERK